MRVKLTHSLLIFKVLLFKVFILKLWLGYPKFLSSYTRLRATEWYFPHQPCESRCEYKAHTDQVLEPEEDEKGGRR